MKILQRTIRRKRGKHCARIRFEDNNGKIHEIMRTADNKSAAKIRLAQLEAEILEKGTARFEAGKVTFRELAEYVKTIKGWRDIKEIGLRNRWTNRDGTVRAAQVVLESSVPLPNPQIRNEVIFHTGALWKRKRSKWRPARRWSASEQSTPLRMSGTFVAASPDLQ